MATPASYPLFCMGNPLLDMQVGSEKLLEKSNRKASDAILASKEHMPIYSEIVKDHNPIYVAGGAAQSLLVLRLSSSAELLRLRRLCRKGRPCKNSAVSQPAGGCACAVILTGHDRSLVIPLRAAENFDKSRLSSTEILPLVDGAKFYNVGGFFLTHGAESASEIA
ncbi:adenosine kinase [Tulasnella sp. 408]|nr:adenosine kinase [Tulasnella sp. 408]